jgi:hypothetical protein
LWYFSTIFILAFCSLIHISSFFFL